MTTEAALAGSWYCAALHRELADERVIERPFCGGTLRLRATEDGRVAAELDGRATAICVQDDVVFAWGGPPGDAPSYELPHLDRAGFTPSTYDVLEVRTLPSLVMRDLADYEHFEQIHRYGRVTIEEPFTADGARCALAFSFDWPLILGSGVVTTRARSRSVCFGLGYQLTTVESVGGTFETRHRVLPTPTGNGITRVTLGMEIRVRGAPGRVPMLPALGHAFARRAFARDTANDAVGWQTLSEGEAAEARGPLAAYWGWARQFRADEAAMRTRTAPGTLSPAC